MLVLLTENNIYFKFPLTSKWQNQKTPLEQQKLNFRVVFGGFFI